MLRRPERFSGKDYEGIQRICWRVARLLYKEGHIGDAVEMLELGKRVDERVGKTTYRWERRVGEYMKVLESKLKSRK
jgi:hypothetical protein